MQPAPRPKVYLAFAAIYLIWGSTYYGIKEALTGLPPFLLGGLRFLVAAALMVAWCAATRTPLLPRNGLWRVLLTGFLLLFVGNGAVVWVQQDVPSSVVAIIIAVAPLNFTLMDRPQWGVNFRSPATLLGVVAGIAGVWLLFSARLGTQLAGQTGGFGAATVLVMLGAITAWPAGSLFAKYNPVDLPSAAATAWQMVTGAVCFLAVSVLRGEPATVVWGAVPLRAWLALGYLVVFGSIIGYSAYVWLLRVRPATQVSTYAYVNPVVAVLLGVFVGNEVLGWRELSGLVVILGGVLLINLAKYRAAQR
jgi:drug/metabolite transporter (DMT)-like permease